jgi:fused signal recognition particle receptor
MFDDIQDLYSLVYAVVAAVDAEISLLVVGLGLLYCIVGIVSLKAKGAQQDALKDVKVLKGDIEALTKQVQDLQRQLSVRGASSVVEAAPAPEVAPPLPLRDVVPPPPAPPSVEPVVPVVEPIVSAAPPVPPVVEVSPPPAPEVSPMARGMAKSRTSLLGKLKGLFTGKKGVDLASLDDLEEMLITSDVGARVADSLVTSVRERASGDREISESELKDLLKDGIRKELIALPNEHRLYHPVGTPLVILVVGVNGVGKTTTVAKLATRYKEQGKKVLAIAADTFRAAAVQQLNEWGNRSGFTVFSGAENAKPAAVVFDGMVAAKDQGVDVVLIDTAGRLHTKSNLMQELEGVRNSIRRHVPDAPHETVLVVDGVSGQNALSQAREFNASTPLTGLVVTKLDGTPKGGIIVAISQELKIPVFYVGVGEKAKDLIQFSVEEFVDGLLSEDGEGGAQSLSRLSVSGGQEMANTM